MGGVHGILVAVLLGLLKEDCKQVLQGSDIMAEDRFIIQGTEAGIHDIGLVFEIAVEGCFGNL